MRKRTLAMGIALAVGVAGAGVARAEADEALAAELAKAMLAVLDENAKAFSQLTALLANEKTACATARASADADLDLRLRHLKALNARVKELHGRADADTIAAADKLAKDEGEAKMQRMSAKMPETQRILKRFHERCPEDASKLKEKTTKLAQVAE